MSSLNQTTLIALAMASQALVVCSDLTERTGDERASAREVEREPPAPAATAAQPARKPSKRFVACYEPESP